MKIVVVHFGYESDGVTALYIDEVHHSHGDEYHDKMEKWVEGFISGVQYTDVSFTHEDHYIPEEKCIPVCQEGQQPPVKWPDTRKRYFKHKLTKDELP
jgi:hypothetical protein